MELHLTLLEKNTLLNYPIERIKPLQTTPLERSIYTRPYWKSETFAWQPSPPSGGRQSWWKEGIFPLNSIERKKRVQRTLLERWNPCKKLCWKRIFALGSSGKEHACKHPIGRMELLQETLLETKSIYIRSYWKGQSLARSPIRRKKPLHKTLLERWNFYRKPCWKGGVFGLDSIGKRIPCKTLVQG